MKTKTCKEILEGLSETITKQIMLIHEVEMKLEYDGESMLICDGLSDVVSDLNAAIDDLEETICDIELMIQKGIVNLEEEKENKND